MLLVSDFSQRQMWRASPNMMIFNRNLHFIISPGVKTRAERCFKTRQSLIVSIATNIILLLRLMNALQGDTQFHTRAMKSFPQR